MRKQNEVKIEYGIAIVKPWSQAMYDHNDEVAVQARAILNNMLQEFRDKLDPAEESMQKDDLQNFGSRVVGYGGWLGFENERIMDEIEREINNAPYYRLKDIAEYLGIELEKGFVGFN